MTSGFTKLEREIMAAMAHDLRAIAPDLAGQFEESLPGTRRNTGSGLFSEIIVSSHRPLSVERANGRFGTVHAMIGDLPDPVAFQVELREGRLLALHGDAYGQDTRAIEFDRIPFDQVFTVDEHGRSVEFDPVALMPPSPLLALHQNEDSVPEDHDQPLVNRGALERIQGRQTIGLLERDLHDPAEAEPDSEALKSLMIGIWVILGAVGLIAVILLRTSLFVVIIGAFWVAALLRKKPVKAALAGIAKALGKFEVRPS